MSELFIQTLSRGRPAGSHIPVWLMRQAGRFMPDYLALREGIPFLDFCKNSDLCVQATMLPIDQLGTDAAILFADILLIPEALGLDLAYLAGEGPHFDHAIRSPQDIANLSLDRFRENIGYVYQTVSGCIEALNGRVPLIGFAGSPFTVASYMVEGSHSKDHRNLKLMMWSQDGRFDTLMTLLTDATIEYLTQQVKHGAKAIQLFDTWLETLSPADYRRYVLPFHQKIFAALQALDIPTIYFGKGIGRIIDDVDQLGCTALSVDWASDLKTFVDRHGAHYALQGNLDPVVLYGDRKLIAQKVHDVLQAGSGTRRHVFNLGHGISPDMEQDKVKFLIDTVHETSLREFA